MKKLTTILTVLFLSTFLMAGSAMAVGFDFGGSFEFTDEDGDNFFETLDLNASLFGKNFITSADPGLDATLDLGSYVLFDYGSLDGFKLNSAADGYSSGARYSFNPDTYFEAFKSL